MDGTPVTTRIKRELLDSMYYRDVRYNLRSRFRWKFIGDFTEAFSHIFTGVATILAFASGFFGLDILAFLAGCFGAVSLVILQFSSYAVKESRERTVQVNRILRKLGMDEIADITIDSTGVSNNQAIPNSPGSTDPHPPEPDIVSRGSSGLLESVSSPVGFTHYAVDV